MGIPFPAWLTAAFSCCVLSVVVAEPQSPADKQSLWLPYLLPSPRYPRTPSGNQEGTRKTQTSGAVRNKASDKLTRMVYESRRQAVGCPNEQRVILIALGKSKETNKSHWCRHKTKSQNPFATQLELQWHKVWGSESSHCCAVKQKDTLHELPSWELQ